MILKKDSQALEPLWTKDIVGTISRSYLLDRKMIALSHGTIIPDDFVSELEGFKDRNAVIRIKGDGKICCQQCLKAYALTKANKLGFEENVIREIGKMIKGKVGHEGYYMDEGELVIIA